MDRETLCVDLANRAQEATGRGVLPSTVAAVLDALAAAGAGEAVDREVLAQAIATAIRRDRDPERIGHDPAPVDYIAADAVLAILAARGDAAAPTVTAEQLERLARSLADDTANNRGSAPWTDDSWAHVRRPFMDRTAARLRAVGIAVEGGEQP